jgi:ABC-type branched-subunit amino acid transport system ATPase component
MTKPIIQIKIEGPQGSGKTTLAQIIVDALEAIEGYKTTTPASSYDAEDSFHLENKRNILQIRTKQVFSQMERGENLIDSKPIPKRENWFWRIFKSFIMWQEAVDKKSKVDLLIAEKRIAELERDILYIRKTGKKFEDQSKTDKEVQDV